MHLILVGLVKNQLFQKVCWLTNNVIFSQNVWNFAGSLSIAVPGEVMGYYEAWRMFGRLPWAELLQPVIDMCMGGFEVEWALALAIRESEHLIRQNEEFRCAVGLLCVKL